MAKKRGTRDSKPCKPKLVFSYPVPDNQSTSYNVHPGVPINPMQLIVNPQPTIPQITLPIIVPRIPVILTKNNWHQSLMTSGLLNKKKKKYM